jgi:hypothetical protein
MSQDNKIHWTVKLGAITALIGAIAALITAIGFPNFFPNLIDTFWKSEKPVSPLEDLVIIVKDSETKKTLDNADIEITYKKGIIPGRTLDDGTYRLQIPPQALGIVKILVKKEGYQQKEIPKDFSVNPNEPLTIYLEPDSTENEEQAGRETPQEEVKIRTLEWSDTPLGLNYRGRLDQDFTFNCPSGGSTNHKIWGTDIYTDDSSICTAAVHYGLITARDGGQVTIRIKSDEEFYQGTKCNGVKSSEYDNKNGSYGSFIFIDREYKSISC